MTSSSDSMPPAPIRSTRATAQGDERDFRMAATVLLTRGGGESLELFLVRRSPLLAVFPGWWALPGGNVDACDGATGTSSLTPFLRAAARELFEECGVLLPALALALEASRGGVAMSDEDVHRDARVRLRRELTLNERHGARTLPREWLALLERASAPFDAFDPFCWATTPAFAALRHRALYVHLELPVGEEPAIESGELVEGRWWKPREVRDAWLRGELWLVPPVAFLLQDLWSGCTLAQAKQRSGRRSERVDAGRLHVVQPAPGLRVAPLTSPTLPPAKTTNCAIVGWDPAYVVDPATYVETERAQLCEWIDEERANGLRVAGVIATHHHRDHVGAIDAVARHCDVPVLAHARTLERLPIPPNRSRELEDDDRVELGRAPDGTGDWHLVAWHTPGHDAGHLVFRDSRYRWLVGGDLVSTLSTIVIEPPEGHLATYLSSVRRVLDAGCTAILPAHGGIVADGPKLLRRYLEHRAVRERMLVGALERAGEADIEALLPVVYADTPIELHAFARMSLLAGLQKLGEEGRAIELGAGRWRAQQR